MTNRENNVSSAGHISKRVGKLGNIVSTTKMFLNLLGNIFASWKINFVTATMFLEVGKQGSIDRKHNVCATMFPSSQQCFLCFSLSHGSHIYLNNSLEDFFFMTVHFRKRSNLCKVNIFSVSKCNDFIKREY